jgi:hypothetical protein
MNSGKFRLNLARNSADVNDFNVNLKKKFAGTPRIFNKQVMPDFQ